MQQPAAAQLDDKQAEAAIKAALKSVPKTQNDQLNDVVGEISALLKANGKAVSSGASSPGAGASALGESAGDLAAGTATASNDTLVGVHLTLGQLLNISETLPPSALIGTGSTLDKTLEKLVKQHRSAVAKGRKALTSLSKPLGKQGLANAVRTPDEGLLPVAPGLEPVFGGGGKLPGDGALFPPALPPIALGALIGTSDADVPGDGNLRVFGRLRASNEPVVITGIGPDGATFGPVEATIDPIDSDAFSAEITGLAEGNWRVQLEQLGVIVADHVGVPGSSDTGNDPETPKEVAKSVKKAWSDLTKLHGKDAAFQAKNFAARLKDAKADIKGGADVGEVLDEVFEDIVLLQRFMHEITNEDLGDQANAVFAATLASLDQLVPDLLVGTGLSGDKAAATVEKRNDATNAKARKAALSFAKSLVKPTDWRMSVDLAPTPFVRVAPVKGTALPALPVPLRVEAIMGASQQSVDDDGVLWVRFTCDPAGGDELVVSLLGPGGYSQTLLLDSSVGADGENLRFPESGAGNLPEGNYLVVLTQGIAQTSAAVSIPGQP